jgi:hypothetical protein
MTFNKRSKNKKMVFAPGCGLMLYKPELAQKIHKVLNPNYAEMSISKVMNNGNYALA